MWIALFCVLTYVVIKKNFAFDRDIVIAFCIILVGLLLPFIESFIDKKGKIQSSNFTITYFLSLYFGFIILHFCVASFFFFNLESGNLDSNVLDSINIESKQNLVYLGFLMFGICAIFGLYSWFKSRYKLTIFCFIICLFYVYFENLTSSYLLYYLVKTAIFPHPCFKCI